MNPKFQLGDIITNGKVIATIQQITPMRYLYRCINDDRKWATPRDHIERYFRIVVNTAKLWASLNES